MKKTIIGITLLLTICLTACKKNSASFCADINEKVMKQEDIVRYYFRVVKDNSEIDFEVQRDVFFKKKLGQKFCLE